MISSGRIVADAATDALSEEVSGGGILMMEVEGSSAVVRDAIGAVEGVKRVTKGSGMNYTVEYESGADVRRGIFNALSKANCPILMMRPGGMSLEESFLKLTEGGED
jgi:ABC-2 type transport system ATP-binding protein